MDAAARRTSLHRVLILAAGLAFSALGAAGCKSKPSEPQPGPAPVEVGPEGGSVDVPLDSGGKLSIVVPAGALDEVVQLTAGVMANPPAGAVGPVFELGPHGTKFAKPVMVRFTPGKDSVPATLGPSTLRVATFADGRWEFLPTNHPGLGVIEGATSHFSVFGLVAPCHVAGVGTDFPLTGCPALNPRVQTSAPTFIDASAAPVTLHLVVGPSATAVQVDLTISGLTPGATYYLLIDGQVGLTPVSADASGQIQLQQDTTSRHLLILMNSHGSLDLNAGSCSDAGTWDAASKTCTLTGDYPDAPVYITEPGLTLDCLGHTIGSSTRASLGIYAYSLAGVSVRNCNIVNVDTGVEPASCTGFQVDNVTVSVPAGSDPASIGFCNIFGGPHAYTNIAAYNVVTGYWAAEAMGASVRTATFRASGPSIHVTSSFNQTFEDITVDGTLSGAGPVDPLAEVPVGAVVLENARSTILRGVSVTAATAFETAIAIDSYSRDISIESSSISGARRAIRIDGPTSVQVTDTSLTGNQEGLALLSGSHLVFHNNIYGNTGPQVSSLDPVELSDTRAASPSFAHGNYWGHSCPDPLFAAGIDSNRADVIDSQPFGQPFAWLDGGAPGCTAALGAPVLSAPVGGGHLNTATPQFAGTAPSNSEVRILEGLVVRATTNASVAGFFSVAPTAPLSEGAHTVTARAHLGGATSPDSSPISFTIDTIAPSAPQITIPLTGTILADGNTAFGGNAEPQATVSILEGTVVVGTGTSDAAGAFAIAAVLTSGSHSVVAKAIDLAGNQSAPSSAVTVQVTAVTAATPINGPGRMLTITKVTHSPTPFDPGVGQTSDLMIAGTVKWKGKRSGPYAASDMT